MAVKDYFVNGKLLKQVNATFLALVPKTQCPYTATDFRPIPCCTVIYKVLTKVIPFRLQEVLLAIIGPAQGAFLKERSIVDSLSVCQGLVRNYHRNTGQLMR